MTRIFKRKQFPMFLRFGVLFGLIAFMIWGLICWPVGPVADDESIVINDNWTQIVEGESVPLERAQDADMSEEGQFVVLEKTLPALETDPTLLFYVAHQEVRVFLDGDLEYTLTCPEELDFFGSPGRTWVMVPFCEEDSGKTLRVELSSHFSGYHIIPQDFYLVPINAIPGVKVSVVWFRTLVALVVLGLAVITYVNSRIWKDHPLRRTLCTMGDVFLFSGMWLCFEINNGTISLVNPAIVSMLAMIFIRLIPIGYYTFVSTTVYGRPTWMKVLGFLAWADLILGVAHQCFGISMVATLPVTVILAGISTLCYGIAWFRYIVIRRYEFPYYRVYGSTWILMLAVILEAACYYHNETLGQLNGLFVALGCIGYAFLAHIHLVRSGTRTATEKEGLEVRQNALDKRPLNQQISAHFLFNTLNTISAYCKEDPETADLAVNHLAQYMRRYMHLVAREGLASFQEELDLMDEYIQILNLRFRDQIHYVVEADFRDFGLPALSLQPLVENAVNHGIHNFVKNGIITISTKKYEHQVQVLVTDNGKGFDYNPKEEPKGVGIKNLSRRITAMGGSLQVKSQPDKGTTIILSIPLG